MDGPDHFDPAAFTQDGFPPLEADPATAGRVHIVGAGPGAADLLTIRAWRALQGANVVLHDALVSADVLACIPRSALRVDVGKRAGSGGAGQRAIHAAMIAHVRAGRTVVRLKGGDPAVFGRLGEEIVALAAAGVPFDIVPGITAASGCAASLGIPLTDRDGAHSLHVVTARRAAEVTAEDWREYARADRTLVVYMGGAQWRAILAALVAAGRAAGTAVAIVENGTRPGARVHRTTLGAACQLDVKVDAAVPLLLIVGHVVDYMPLPRSTRHVRTPTVPVSNPRPTAARRVAVRA